MSPSAARPAVQVLRVGYLVRDGSRVVDASSTVTLIVSTRGLAIVDTGSPRECRALVAALKKKEVSPSDISYVVSTHLHIDHCGCNDIFPNARLVAHALESPPAATLRISEAMELLPGVEVVPTPGHSEGSISVFVSSDRRYAICGDAIPTRENYEKHVPPAVNFDPRLALSTLDAIASWADVIVPGHDAPFDVIGKK